MAQTYFDGSDASQIYKPSHKTHETRQQGKTLTSDVSTPYAYWQDLDFSSQCDMECVVDTTNLKKKIKNESINFYFYFLIGK